MDELGWLWIIASISTLLLIGITGQRLPSPFARFLPRVIQASLAVLALGLVGQAFWLAQQGSSVCALPGAGGLELYCDSLTLIMAWLICFLGIIVTQFSIRYLDGQPRWRYFFGWLAFTLASVLGLVVAGNLLLLLLAWIANSLGLHRWLTFYPERREAVIAARTKFLISRCGDLLLISGIALTYFELGTLRYDQLFAAAEAQVSAGASSTISWISVLLVLGAMTKSAQFPFHSWLPNTTETPTPVSALMHAGIINAGGFLIIRLSPIVSHSWLAMDLLASVGAVTAILGSLVAVTQTSVKRSLAYSTIAQMGFMMLQCGLGAFSAALLHIVAHSAYKAHAFLSSGAVLESARARAVALRPTHARLPLILHSLLSLAVATLLWLAIGFDSGILIPDKPGMIVLTTVMVLAVSQLLASSWSQSDRGLWLRTMLYAAGVMVAYELAYRVFDLILAHSVSHLPRSQSPADLLLSVAVMLAFALLWSLATLMRAHPHSRWLIRLYVHASAGFYIDLVWRRMVVSPGRLPQSV